MRSGCCKVNYTCPCGLNEWGEKMLALLNCELLEMVKVKYECWTWIEQTCDEL